jgi:hypothetical protein
LCQIAAREAQYTRESNVLLKELDMLGFVVFSECFSRDSRFPLEEPNDLQD